MRTGNILPILAALTNAVLSKTTFAVWPANGVNIGESHNVVWFTDGKDRITELIIVRKGDVDRGDPPELAWKSVVTLLSDADTQLPGGQYTWEVEDWLEPGDGYALWIDSEPKHWFPWMRGKGGYSDLTNWFNVSAAGEKRNQFTVQLPVPRFEEASRFPRERVG